MPNILLLDDSETASCAMRGILARGNHHLLVASNSSLAWQTIRALVRIDLLIMEVKMEGANSLQFLQKLRGDCILKHLPVVIYTALNDHALAKRASSFNIQNYLLKPYRDEAIYTEIAKAIANPWRNLLFEEEKSFCAQMRLSADDLRKSRQTLVAALEECVAIFPRYAETKPYKEASERIASLKESAELSGVWGAVEYLETLRAKIQDGAWDAFATCQDDLDYVRHLIHCQINPDYIPKGLTTEPDPEKAREAANRVLWMESDVDSQGPLVTAAQIQAQLDQLAGMPVVNTAAAAFQMTAGMAKPNWDHLLDQVSRDPALTALVLMAANRLERDEKEPINDSRTAMALLGDLRLAALARSLQVVDERLLHFPPITWASYWTFQMGVANMAQFASHYLELHDVADLAFTAGLLHDIGNLLLIKLHPFGFQAIVNHARKHAAPLRATERKYLGCDTREAGYHFARKNSLPEPYCDVIRWTGQPEESSENTELVALVSLARDLCLHNHVGDCGDKPEHSCPALDTTSAWSILHGKVFPNTRLRQLEVEAQRYCSTLCKELQGKSN